MGKGTGKRKGDCMNGEGMRKATGKRKGECMKGEGMGEGYREEEG